MRIEEVVPDASVSPGGCVLEAGERTWDATVGGQLEQLHEALREALESGS
jgi:flagellar biosynthesis/type III secretory pathway protein FliH